MVELYKKECKRVTGKLRWLNPSQVKRLVNLERVLESEDIDPIEYLIASIALWQDYAEKNNMEFPPVEMLCGAKALERYLKTLPITKKEYERAVLLRVELNSFQLMLNEKLYRFIANEEMLEEVRGEFEVLVGMRWNDYTTIHWDMYVDISEEVIIHYSELYGINVNVEDVSYKGLVNLIVEHIEYDRYIRLS